MSAGIWEWNAANELLAQQLTEARAELARLRSDATVTKIVRELKIEESAPCAISAVIDRDEARRRVRAALGMEVKP